MAQNKRDENRITVGSGVSTTDSITPLMLRVDPVTERLLVSSSSDSLTPTAATMVKRDQNFKPTYYGISNADNTTLIPIRTDSTGKLLIKTS